ncbi:MAG: redoxin domain-containing protein [Deltaproteobacteria bacterium]|nr:redoxin domain-containing protein [Deltaproteobacteria bacterium]NIS77829.1 redoxin domain-containing protein [Deltaproteobacteria bacterium]
MRAHNEKKIFTLFLAILISLFMGVKSSRSFALRTLSRGDTIKNYEVPILEGNTQTMEKLCGEKGLLLVFWTTWSERSLQLITYANQELAKEYGEKGINIVGINVESQSITSGEMKTITETVERLNVSIPLGIDRDLVMYDEIGVISTPTTVLVSKELKIEGAYPGFPTAAREELKSMLNAFLGIEEKKPTEEVRYLMAKKPKNNALLFYNLGKNLYKRYVSMKDELTRVPRNAVDKLDDSIERDPDFYSPYLLKAIIFHKAKEEEKKKETLKSIEERAFSEPVEVRDLAYMYFILGMLDRSGELIVKLKEMLPDEPTVPLLEALLALSQDKKEEASAQFKEIMEKGGLPFDLAEFIDPETGGAGSAEGADMAVRLIPEKVLNISKK